MSKFVRSTSVTAAAALAIVSALVSSSHAFRQAPGSLSGMVVSVDTPPRPVRRAIVSLTGASLSMNLSTVSDDSGAFGFANLPPGTYTVTVSKAAYLTTALGARRPGQPGTPVALGAGQRITNLRLALARGAVLSGTVHDASGGPVTNVPISIAPVASLNGTSDYASPLAGSILTDDRGSYRMYGLMPGEYVVVAAPRMPGPGAITPRIAVRLPAPSIDALLRDLQARAAGRAAPAPPESPPSLPRLMYAPIYFPGTAVAQDATRIHVGAGELRENLDFVLDFVSTARLEGRIVMSDGSPVPGVSLSLSPIGPSLPLFASMTFGSQQNPDGTFAYLNLTPGRYVLFARGAAGTPPTDTSGRGAVVSRGGGPGGAGALWAMADVTITGVDISGVVLTMRPTLTVTGKIVFDGTEKAPTDFSAMQVGLVRATEVVSGTGALATPIPGVPTPTAATVGAGGAFQFTGVWPGSYVPVSSVPGAPAWRLRSALINGHDILDEPLMLDAGSTDISGAVLTFSARHSTLSGTLQLPSGQAASGYSVIVFPASRVLWQSGRRVQSIQPATDGSFKFDDLPAGEYWLAAIGDVDPVEWRRAAFLDQAASAGVKVTTVDGQTAFQNLRIR